MMDDLIARLRQYPSDRTGWAACQEAADTIRQQAERIERLEQVGRELIKHLDIVGAEGSLIEEFRAALTTAAPEGPKETNDG